MKYIDEELIKEINENFSENAIKHLKEGIKNFISEYESNFNAINSSLNSHNINRYVCPLEIIDILRNLIEFNKQLLYFVDKDEQQNILNKIDTYIKQLEVCQKLESIKNTLDYENCNNEDKLNTTNLKNINSEDYNYVNSPTHYNEYDVEVIDMMERIWGKEDVKIWAKLTAWKYRQRMGTKPGEPIERDIEKEQWYLKKYNELKNN